MKKIIKSIAFTFLEEMLNAFIKHIVKLLEKDKNISPILKEKIVDTLYKIDLKDFIKNV